MRLEDCSAAATDQFHRRELAILDMTYRNVMARSDLKSLTARSLEKSPA